MTDTPRCNHRYSEGWFRQTVWYCQHPQGHKGWHLSGNRVWDDAMLQPVKTGSTAKGNKVTKPVRFTATKRTEKLS